MSEYKHHRLTIWGLATAAGIAIAAAGGAAIANAPAKPGAQPAAVTQTAAQPAASIQSAAVEPVADGRYKISWGATASPVDIYVADKPDAEKPELLAQGVTGTSAELAVKLEGRPYFYLEPKGQKPGQGVWVAERLLPLEGGRNFRDMGGYTAEDGRTVRWGKVFRSGAMAELTAADQQYLADLGIRQVCDFRTTSERKDENAKWLQDNASINYWTRDYEMTDADLGRVMTGELTAEEARSSMINLYRDLPYEQKTAYRDMFRMLVDGQIPLAFNCTAGKDRAGFAAALILTSLGVPYQTVLADYELTNRYLPLAYTDERMKKAGREGMTSWLTKLSKEAIDALMGADPAYLRTAFASIESKNGTVDNYFRDELGLTDADREALKSRLLR